MEKQVKVFPHPSLIFEGTENTDSPKTSPQSITCLAAGNEFGEEGVPGWCLSLWEEISPGKCPPEAQLLPSQGLSHRTQPSPPAFIPPSCDRAY